MTVTVQERDCYAGYARKRPYTNFFKYFFTEPPSRRISSKSYTFIFRSRLNTIHRVNTKHGILFLVYLWFKFNMRHPFKPILRGAVVKGRGGVL